LGRSIPTHRVACKFCAKNASTCDGRRRRAGDGSVIKFFFLLLKPILYFLEKIFTDGFLSSTASGNRFPPAITARGKRFPSAVLFLPVCIINYFYWHLTLAVLKNTNINKFTTATIELLCSNS
jgi:hypothetical protein